jgi:CheY-like chemotaxis protein
MNGTITVDSHMNQGSKIVVNCILPQYDGRKEEAEGIEDVSAAEEILHGTVLLAEDNQINAEIASRLLESIGLKCVHAVNGEEAVKLFQASAPDDYICILMDIRMPVMNGHDAARAIRDLDRSDAKDIPIIALTADAIHEDTKKAYDSGMNAYLTKPIDLQKLKKTIQQLAKKE